MKQQQEFDWKASHWKDLFEGALKENRMLMRYDLLTDDQLVELEMFIGASMQAKAKAGVLASVAPSFEWYNGAGLGPREGSGWTVLLRKVTVNVQQQPR